MYGEEKYPSPTRCDGRHPEAQRGISHKMPSVVVTIITVIPKRSEGPHLPITFNLDRHPEAQRGTSSARGTLNF